MIYFKARIIALLVHLNNIFILFYTFYMKFWANNKMLYVHSLIPPVSLWTLVSLLLPRNFKWKFFLINNIFIKLCIKFSKDIVNQEFVGSRNYGQKRKGEENFQHRAERRQDEISGTKELVNRDAPRLELFFSPARAGRKRQRRGGGRAASSSHATQVQCAARIKITTDIECATQRKVRGTLISCVYVCAVLAKVAI